MSKSFNCSQCGASLEVPSKSLKVSPTEGIQYEKPTSVTCKFCGTTNPIPNDGDELFINGDVVGRDKIVYGNTKTLWTVELKGPKKFIVEPIDCFEDGDHGTQFYWDNGVKRCCYCRREQKK